ncbi:MAG TPA: CoA transferase [Gemmatimonadaceae bacterium]|jgi:crotonobetainyl-CoA:carnitine CoA-transferase CaiB-like acyl-CoA transferase|nr:CoA transferase [Gemmatimonadaceae bacterium]
MRQQYLSSVKVLDMTRVLAGPICTMMLGDLGANVIKIERPVHGDDTRGWGPPFDSDGESAYFLSINRNKWSVAADLDDPADQALVRRLVAGADVVVENFMPGALERRGLGAAELLAACPRLIWCTIVGYGVGDPRPGYDFAIQAERGWMAITGEPDGAPMKAGVALADVIAGKDAAVAILAGLVGRGVADAERHVVISLAHSATAALVNVAQNVLVSGQDAGRWGNAHPNLVPYQLLQAADRPIVLAVGNDAQWARCADVLGLAPDSAWATNAGRSANRKGLVEAVAARIAERPAAEWVRRLGAVGVPTGLVRTVTEALSDVDCSAVTGVAPVGPGRIRYRPPRLDEHGTKVRAAGWEAFSGERPGSL